MTVYQCITNYESYSKFRFNAKGRNIVGMMVARIWKEQGYEKPETITSVEKDGTFAVYNYPDHFVEYIDNTIHSYVKKCLEKKAKKIIEKPLIKEPSAPNSISYSSKPPTPPKKRARKPIQAPPQPAFSGKKLIKGK